MRESFAKHAPRIPGFDITRAIWRAWRAMRGAADGLTNGAADNRGYSSATREDQKYNVRFRSCPLTFLYIWSRFFTFLVSERLTLFCTYKIKLMKDHLLGVLYFWPALLCRTDLKFSHTVVFLSRNKLLILCHSV